MRHYHEHYHEEEPQGCGVRGVVILIGIMIFASIIVFFQADNLQTENSDLIITNDAIQQELLSQIEENIQIRSELDSLKIYVNSLESELMLLREQVVSSP